MLPQGIASVPLDVLHPRTLTPHARSSYTVPSSRRAAWRDVSSTSPSLGGDAAAPHTVASHASHAATCHVSVLGAHVMALARVLVSTRELEVQIVGPQLHAPPMSFIFPAPILAHVGIVEDAASSDIHVLAITQTGFLYRLRLPLASFLRGQPLPHAWAHEHQILHLSSHASASSTSSASASTSQPSRSPSTSTSLADTAVATSVHVIDIALILVSCADGALLRIQQRLDDRGAFTGAWLESVLRPSTFLFSRLFSRSHSEHVAPTQTLALATHIRDTDTPLAFSVCRDRKLRVWNIATDTLVRTLDLPGSSDTVWEERTTQPLVQLFYPADRSFSFYVLVYVPMQAAACLAAYGVELEESSSWSGGVGDMALVWSRACDARTNAPDIELRDMAVVYTGQVWRVWLLWHAAGAPLLQTTLVDGLRAPAVNQAPLVLGDTDDPWATVHPLSPYTPLHGPDMDAALESQASAVATVFVSRLCEPARFSATTLAAALEAEGVHVMGEPLPRIVAAIAATVGAGSLEAWLRFTRRVELIDRAARWPLRLCMLDDVPCIIARHALGIACARDAGAWLASLAARLAAAAPHPDRPSARLAGEAASAEYAYVVNSLAQLPHSDGTHDLKDYARIHDGSTHLLRVATLAAELYDSLGPRAPRLVDAYIAEAQRTASPMRVRIPTSLHGRLSALIEQMGGDGLVREAERLVTLYQHDSWPSFAWLDALTAYAHMAGVHARLHGTRALLVLLSLVTHTHVPQIQRIRSIATDVWHTARAMYVLASSIDDEPTVGLVHRALQRGVPQGASVDAFCNAVLTDAPDVVRTCLLTAASSCSSSTGSNDSVLVHDTACTPSTTYLIAKADACRGRVHEAYQGFVCVNAALTAAAKTHPVWERVLPADVLEASDHPTTQFRFWCHAATLVEGDVRTSYECYRHAMHALEAGAKDVLEPDARKVWTLVFRSQLALHMYEAAGATILSLPFDDLRTTCITSLVTTLCEAQETRTLLRLDLLEWQPHIERTLSFQARHASPLAHPSYFHILYAYHVSRGDYKSAAASMYQHAHRLGVLTRDAPSLESMQAYAVQQAQSFLVCINALVLLPATLAWFAHDNTDSLAATGRPTDRHALRGRVTHYVPQPAGPASLAIVQLADVRREYHELLTRLQLMQTYPELAHGATPWRADDALPLFVANDDYDAAWSTAEQLQLPMDSFFDALTLKCVLLERAFHKRAAHYEHEDEALKSLYMGDEEEADPNAAFLRRSARTASWPGHAHERAWKYLRVHLEATEHGVQYRRIIAERLIALRAWDLSPEWLIDWFRQHAPDVLIRVWMQYGMLEHALAYCIQLVDASLSELRTSNAQPKACLPYTLMDSLLVAADKRGLHEPSSTLRKSLDARMNALKKKNPIPHAPSSTAIATSM